MITFTYDALNGDANPTRKSLDKTAIMFESRISDGERGPTTWKDMLENVWNGIANWQTKKTEQLYKVSHPCLDDHQIRKEELEMPVLGTKWST